MMKVNKRSLLADLVLAVDDLLRHKNLLGQCQWIRNWLRKPYHRVINYHGMGIPVNIGGCMMTRLPPEFSSKLMEHYEVEAMTALRRWLVQQSNPLIIDVGCSQGYVSCGVLFTNPSATVIAIDSDLNSLKTLLRVCKYRPSAGSQRLFPVWGMINQLTTAPRNYKNISTQTIDRLKKDDISGDPGTHRYVNLNSEEAMRFHVPTYSLDDLCADIGSAKEILIKIDVEGAELEVLKGAQHLLQTGNPVLSVSVHPDHIKRFGHVADDVHEFMKQMGYSGHLLAKDHEEHWWYEAS